jgi:hypothetical protein
MSDLPPPRVVKRNGEREMLKGNWRGDGKKPVVVKGPGSDYVVTSY